MKPETQTNSPPLNNTSDSEIAWLAGGCFWGMQDLLRQLPGVISTRVGYTGGQLANASYDQVKTGRTGHAEAIEVVFNPKQLSFPKLLAAFFQIHDPSTPNRQGNDRGSQYRSAIFTHSELQATQAREVIQAIQNSGRWPAAVVTEVAPATQFWAAEPEHQDYLQRYPWGYTCHFVRPEWTLEA
jgi:peptide-methionine (S)-S-oxide reductase